MSYNKAIITGETLELYQYEKNLQHFGRRSERGSGLSGIYVMPSVVEPRISKNESSVSQEQVSEIVGKRRDNQKRAGMSFRRLVSANLAQFGVPYFITVQYRANTSDLGRGYKDYEAFIRAMRYKFKVDFRYIVVPEFQKRGALHFHALFWGLPENLHTSERSTRLVAGLWGYGFTDVVKTDGNEKLVGYLSKYMVKSYGDSRLVGFKAYRASRNVARPVVEKGVGIAYLEEMYSDYMGVDKFPCKEKFFLTQWLGKGRYSLFKKI